MRKLSKAPLRMGVGQKNHPRRKTETIRVNQATVTRQSIFGSNGQQVGQIRRIQFKPVIKKK